MASSIQPSSTPRPTAELPAILITPHRRGWSCTAFAGLGSFAATVLFLTSKQGRGDTGQVIG